MSDKFTFEDSPATNERIGFILGVLAKRAGGSTVITFEEMDTVKGRVIHLTDTDGGIKLSLLSEVRKV